MDEVDVARLNDFFKVDGPNDPARCCLCVRVVKICRIVWSRFTTAQRNVCKKLCKQQVE